ncbi:protein Aster-A isoform X2 [Hemicordylus capensis]|uniref:protein Aster-A isoform X2 n=1 Tax=Hemicordylus capensis TaxID=884348 RepID=UPI0023031E06|nr:protein Aster-A isoform X2 [Hemicordylus capensis]
MPGILIPPKTHHVRPPSLPGSPKVILPPGRALDHFPRVPLPDLGLLGPRRTPGPNPQCEPSFPPGGRGRTQLPLPPSLPPPERSPTRAPPVCPPPPSFKAAPPGHGLCGGDPGVLGESSCPPPPHLRPSALAPPPPAGLRCALAAEPGVRAAKGAASADEGGREGGKRGLALLPLPPRGGSSSTAAAAPPAAAAAGPPAGSRRARPSIPSRPVPSGRGGGAAGACRAMFETQGRSLGGRTGTTSPRTTPSSSPSLRKRLLLLPPRPPPESPPETMVEKGSENSVERGPQPGPPPSTPLNYPLSGRSFIRNNKKMQSWYSMLSPTYKQRNEDFRRIFKGLPEGERLLVDYSCALQRDILLQGRLYLSENWICFYSNIFRWETTISIQLKEVQCIKKEKTAKLIPNAIQICTETEKHFFTSFGARDRCFLLIFRLWQNALLDKTLSPRELWHIVHQCYGSELGLTSEDDDYVSPVDEINGLGSPKEIGDIIDLSDLTSRCSTDFKLDPSPLLEKRDASQSINSLASSSDGTTSLAEDPEENTDSQMDASSSHTVTSTTEPPGDELPRGLTSPLEGDPLPSEELPTDMSNSSSSTQDEAEVDAFFSDLPGRLLINTVYHVGAERLQQMLFSDSPFIHGFFGQRKFTDVTLTSWNGDNKCHQSRVISYTIPISNPLGPKAAAVVETQTLFHANSKSRGCVVDSEVITQGIPYQDYFYTAHRYCITAVAKSKARLRVSSEIRYRKQPWNLVKALIEKNAWSGVEEYFQHLELALVQAEKGLLEESCHGKEPRGLLSGLRRRKRALSWRAPHVEAPIPSLPEGEGTARTIHASGSLTSRLSEQLSEHGQGQSLSNVILIISLVLVVLVILNMMLFYRLWSLEHTARTFESWQAYALSNGKLPQTASEWAEILELQKRFHSVEVQKWKQILKASVELLDEMKISLEKLHQGITVAEPPLEPE